MLAVSLQNLVFRYERKPPILDIKSFSIQKGEKVFLYGPSGSGKTSLLSLITGILSTTNGSVEILGQDLKKLSPQKRDSFRASKIGYIFQQFNLIPYLSAMENILVPVWMSKEKQSRIGDITLEHAAQDLAARLGIADLLDRNVLQLSVGQQQRVAAARALIGQPDLIVADEPTSALDEERQSEFIHLLLERADKNTTLLFVSHNKALATHFDRSISLPEINSVQRIEK